MNQLQISKDFSIPVQDYANQGNAILGIRGAGKTYTGMKAAEELLEASIPIVVFDPIGVWKNLKIGNGKHKGFSVVVAGGPGSDITLTVNNAVDLIRAAMKENVSIIFDLYTPELANKSTWIKIVQETVDVLMNENKSFGLRHVFLEEAAEFIPQRLQPQHYKVYSAIERMARMGRNVGLGLTLINQRAEEVNKAVLEICDFTLLHKQVGKNSLKSIQEWLELRQLDRVADIIKSLPTLEPGYCWAIGQTDQPHKIKISPKNTFHPDPKKAKESQAQKMAVDVSGFVEKMNRQLVKPETAKAKTPEQKGHDRNGATSAEIKSLKQALSGANNRISALLKSIREYETKFAKIQALVTFQAVERNIQEGIEVGRSAIKTYQAVQARGTSSAGSGLSKCAVAIAGFLAAYPMRAFSKVQIAVAIGYSHTSSGFTNSLSELNVRSLIMRDNGKVRINPAGDLSIVPSFTAKAHPAEDFASRLSKCESEIYEVLLKHPHEAMAKEDIADHTPSKYSVTSSGFTNSLSKLSVLELIRREDGKIRLNPELLEL